MEERTVAEAVDGNVQLKRPSTCPPERAAFVSGYARLGEAVFAPLLRGYKWGYRLKQMRVNAINAIRRIPVVYPLLKYLYKRIKHRVG